MTTYLDTYILAGGPLMVLLILCSLLLVGSVVQAIIRLRASRVVPADLLEKARAAAKPEERQACLRALQDDFTPLGEAVRLSLKEIDPRPGRGVQKSQLDPIVEGAVIYVADDLYEELGRLATIYTVAPLIGLLGTILGMISAFREFGAGDQTDLSLLSEGIQEALVTTLWGLGIAIAAFVAAQYFQARIRRFERKELPTTVKNVLVALLWPKPTPATPAGVGAGVAPGIAAAQPPVGIESGTGSPPAAPRPVQPAAAEPEGSSR